MDFQLVCLEDFLLVGLQEQPRTVLDHNVIRTMLEERREKHRSRTVLDHSATRTMVDLLDFQLVYLVDFQLVDLQEQPRTVLDHNVIKTMLEDRREKQHLILFALVIRFVTRIM